MTPSHVKSLATGEGTSYFSGIELFSKEIHEDGESRIAAGAARKTVGMEAA